MKKEKTIILTQPVLGDKAFGLAHAYRIINYPGGNGGWTFKKQKIKMILKKANVPEVLKKPLNQHLIKKAIHHEGRLKFHGLIQFDSSLGQQATEFLMWVKSLLPDDKYKIFLKQLKFPLETSGILDEVYSAFEKVFDGQNRLFKYEFVSDRSSEDWEQYRKEALKEPDVWRNKAFEVMKTAINSVMIVDLASEQNSFNPEPYFYFLPISEVVDFKLDKSGEIEYILFRQKGDKLAVFDQVSFRVYNYSSNKLGEIVSEAEHDLGYCPAKFFWTKSLSVNEPALKQSPISSQLTNLDRYQFNHVNKTNLDLNSSYPIHWGFKAACNYVNEDEKNKLYWWCDGGFLRDGLRGDQYMMGLGGALHECPKCALTKFNGPGTYLEIDPPGPENANANLRDPVGIIGPEVEALKYHDEQLVKLSAVIYAAATGSSFETINNQAVNEKQVLSLFESRKAVLLKIAEQFEIAQTWVDSTICRLRYPDFLSAYISYGTEYYLFDYATLSKAYLDARKEEADHLTLNFLQVEMIKTKFQNNPDQLKRAIMIVNLDPFRHLLRKDVYKLFESSLISFEDFYISINFSTLLARFERENGSIINFGILLPIDQRITAIYEGLKVHIQEQSTA